MLWLFTVLAVASVGPTLRAELHILHTNAQLTHIEEFNAGGKTCSDIDVQAERCYAGVARRMTAIENIRSVVRDSVLLDAGDTLTGTDWYAVFRGQESAHFMNSLDYTALSLGQYDFIHGTETVLSFLQNTTFPSLGCNINITDEPGFTDHLLPSIVKNMSDGERVGIVGYSDDSIPDTFRTGQLIFDDVISAMQDEVARLEFEGVNRIIALGFGSTELHKLVVEEVVGVDVIVYGGPKTLLHNGVPEAPEDENIVAGDYPMVMNPGYDPNVTVLLVSAYKWGKYLGHLNVSFDEDGKVVDWTGNTLLMKTSIQQDADVLSEVTEWKEELNEGLAREIGQTHVLLDASAETCYLHECNFQSLLMDAVVHYYAKRGHRDISMAIVNADSYDNYINETGSGTVTLGDLRSVMLYWETMDVVELGGRYIREAFERSVEEYDGEKPIRYFLQVSGVRVTYDISKPAGQRVKEVLVNCATCRVPEYKPLDDDAVYKFATNSYLASGGSGYGMIGDNRLSHVIGEEQTDDILEEYIRAISPVRLGVEGRITFDSSNGGSECMDPISGAIWLADINISLVILSLAYAICTTQ
ncbi:snake venom 5'-nucleotidase-like isoform X2 [Ptychodera flava]|uniref:snake venom 5'-nucleotidase-like isoform X2 n=1 Tax=Ptychodera flava TaxID=63121 RepID=UPI00396A70EE